MSFDLDDVLDLESKFHDEGYQAGLNDDTRKEYIEGKEYGYQISFQRFLIIGYYKSLIENWLKVISNTTDKTSRHQSVEKSLHELKQKIDELKFDNTESSGNVYDELIKKLKLKMRLINGTMMKLYNDGGKEGDKLMNMNEILREIGGQLEIDNGGADSKNDVDNGMW